jgi:hypothetical protein
MINILFLSCIRITWRVLIYEKTFYYLLCPKFLILLRQGLKFYISNKSPGDTDALSGAHLENFVYIHPKDLTQSGFLGGRRGKRSRATSTYRAKLRAQSSKMSWI